MIGNYLFLQELHGSLQRLLIYSRIILELP